MGGDAETRVASRNDSAGLGQGPGSASKDTHGIFELVYRTETSSKWEMLT